MGQGWSLDRAQVKFLSLSECVLLQTLVEIQEDKLHCTSTLQASDYISFANIPLAKASHMAKPSMEPGNKYYTQQKVEGNEYLLNHSPHYHWVQSLTLYSEKLPSLGLFGGRKMEHLH